MSNLTPVQRADKNGKIVTRHVKIKETTPVRTIAAPTVASPTPAKEMMGYLASALQIPVSDIARYAGESSGDRLDALLNLAYKYDLRYSGEKIIGVAFDIKDKPFSECITLLDRHFQIADDIISTAPGLHPEYIEVLREQVPMLVTGINHHKFEMTPEQEALLITTTSRIWIHDAIDSDEDYSREVFPERRKDGWKSFENTALKEDIAEYVVNHPEQQELVINMVTERRITDPKIISDMAQGSATVPLNQGIL